jgi:hypothetical protein
MRTIIEDTHGSSIVLCLPVLGWASSYPDEQTRERRYYSAMQANAADEAANF